MVHSKIAFLHSFVAKFSNHAHKIHFLLCNRRQTHSSGSELIIKRSTINHIRRQFTMCVKKKRHGKSENFSRAAHTM